MADKKRTKAKEPKIKKSENKERTQSKNADADTSMQDNWGHGRTPSLIADKANET